MTEGGCHPKLTAWLDRVDAHWHQMGLTQAQRRDLRRDLVMDLSQARLSGAPLDELLAVDPARFAADVAMAEGFDLTKAGEDDAAAPVRSAPEPSISNVAEAGVPVLRVACAGLFGSIVGGVGGLALLLPAIGWVNHHSQIIYAAQGGGILATYAIAALVAALCGGLAVAGACVHSAYRRRLGRRTVAGLVVSGAAATFVTVSYAKTTDYSTQTPVIFTEFGLVMVILLIGLITVAWSVRPPRHGGLGAAR